MIFSEIFRRKMGPVALMSVEAGARQVIHILLNALDERFELNDQRFTEIERRLDNNAADIIELEIDRARPRP